MVKLDWKARLVGILQVLIRQLGQSAARGLVWEEVEEA
jgi:hypothetical protein